MIETRLFDVDPVSGTQRFFHFDDETGEFTIETQQDVEALMAATQARAASTDERAGWKGDMHWVGSIPLNIYYELKRQYPDPEELGRQGLHWLQENNNFKTRNGRLV